MRSWPLILRRSFAQYHNNVHKLEPTKGDRVVVAMSGGVDSSVVAKMLSEKDYDLSAIFMRNWDTRDESGTDEGCEWKKDWHDVQQVCKMLDIPCKLVDLSKEYWNRVFQPALAIWEMGGTPNPDLWCNREVKFGALMQHLTSADTWFATGHYARKDWCMKQSPPRPKLMRSVDSVKDQTYFLASIPESSLARSIFPLAPYVKDEVKQMAREWGLPTAAREESMGLCFVGEKRRFDTFLSQYLPPKPGAIVDLRGKQVGEHQGLWSFTIGQNARLKGQPQKMFVSDKDYNRNQIIVVPGREHKALYCMGLVAFNWQWIWADSPPPLRNGFKARAKLRYRMEDIPCTLYRTADESHIRIMFENDPQQAIAAGQSVVVWDGDWCLGCGIIQKTIPLPES
ncbi:tRNA-specific 2-thiouridylase [Phanerochaete sordida]|uniref:tRNA-5-taurinomethyluridine 2-sulfurtransferase n=1 Tax=Phanerochaete sordida TaxID=48140 RepID=A0A9P3G107_9APHY|nr:tRNA-specific 2-thiouridylase [Phanerochaete sordida]